MSEHQNELRCEIIQDLLPLYHDGVVNSVTHKAVERHLLGCEACAQEYRLLLSDLPVRPEPEAASRFSSFAKAVQKKRVTTALIAAVLACILLAAGLYVLTQVPTVPIDASDFQIYRTYRYEVDGKQYFFLMFTQPLYNASTSGLHKTVEDQNGTALVINWRKPILSSKVADSNIQLMTTRLYGSEGSYDVLRFNDTVLWSEEENGSDPIPDYVHHIHEGSIPGFSYNLDIDADRLEVFFDDGRIMEWDLEGNLLFDSAN